MKNLLRFLIAVSLLLVASGCSGASNIGSLFSSTGSSGPLTASGTVETTEVPVAPETSGRIVDIKVQEGDSIKAGDVLFTMDDVLLQAQRTASSAGLASANAAVATAQAAAASAQVQYDIALNAALSKTTTSRTADWYTGQAGEFTLPPWYFNQADQYTAAKAATAAALKDFTDMQDKQTSIEKQSASSDFMQAESDLATAQINYQIANALYNKVKFGKNIDDMTKRQLYLLTIDARLQAKNVDPRWTSTIIAKDIHDEAQNIYDDTKTALKDAQNAYDDAISTDGAKDVLKARAQTSVAEEKYYIALDFQRRLETGPQSETVTAAKSVLDQANAAIDQAQNNVKQAQANLDLINAQMGKNTVTAPVDGVVLSRSGEPGSVVNPGGTVLTLGRLDELTITVYVPETRYGEVSIGQSATVKVDTFPGEVFNATVTYISNQAEFTPRNVQTVEGRSNTVYAIKLKLDDTTGKLKPGMPADVTFGK